MVKVDNAASVANYILDLAKKDKMPLKQLGLMKRLYITHGFCLALINKSAFDPRFDKVEAWKLGPVIPSIYHDFKHFGAEPITARATLMTDWDIIETPSLKNDNVKKVCEVVWKLHKNFTDLELVTATHKKGSPWDYFYKKGENKTIPDEYTKLYYDELLKR